MKRFVFIMLFVCSSVFAKPIDKRTVAGIPETTGNDFIERVVITSVSSYNPVPGYVIFTANVRNKGDVTLLAPKADFSANILLNSFLANRKIDYISLKNFRNLDTEKWDPKGSVYETVVVQVRK